MDDRLDGLHADFIAAIFEGHAAAASTSRSAVQLALIGRFYERIGDHAVNIGERVAVHGHRWPARGRRRQRPLPTPLAGAEY